MSDPSARRRPRRNNELLDSAEDLAAGVGRLGYGLLSLGLDLLPSQSRAHMHKAVRELSYAFAALPRSFAEIAGGAVEEWAAEDEAEAAAPAKAPAAEAPIRRVRVYDSGDAAASAVPPPEARAAQSAAAAQGLAAAQTVAVATAAVGIAHIEYDPPGRDVEGEYVLLRNGGAEVVELTGWRLHDSKANHSYVFPAFTLAPGAEVKVWTRRGEDDAANLYWGERGAIWNNDGDTGTLRDATGAVVSSFTYAGSK